MADSVYIESPDGIFLGNFGKNQCTNIEKNKFRHGAQQAHAEAVNAVIDPVGVVAFEQAPAEFHDNHQQENRNSVGNKVHVDSFFF